VSEGVGSWRLVLLGSGILVFAGVLAGLSSCAGSSRWALALGFLAGVWGLSLVRVGSGLAERDDSFFKANP
jgi:hypothetical protein